MLAGETDLVQFRFGLWEPLGASERVGFFFFGSSLAMGRRREGILNFGFGGCCVAAGAAASYRAGLRETLL